MFDFENPFKEEPIEEEIAEETPKDNWRDWEYAEWEKITSEHAEREVDAAPAACDDTERIYRKAHQRRYERTCRNAVKYALLAIGLTAVAYLVRDIQWLAYTIGGIALIFGLTSAYGAGICHEM